ncbi:MAG: glycosyltransferase family 39 protein [Planctomycetota bacterium]
MNAVSIIVPTVNEAENIDALLDRIAAAADFPYEVLVVDYESTDGTQEKVRARADARLVPQTEKGGLAGAVIQGAREAQHECCVVIDADLSHPPEVLPQMVAPVLAGEKDMVVGSRKVPGGGSPGWPWHRRFTSAVASWLAWPMTDVRDPMSGYFATTRARLLAVDTGATGFKIGFEVLTQDDGRLRTAEVPIQFHDRAYGESKLGRKAIFDYLERLATLAGLRRPVLWPALFAVVDAALLATLQPRDVANLVAGLVAALLMYAAARRSAADDGLSEPRRLSRALPGYLLVVHLRGGLLALGAPFWIVALFGAVLVLLLHAAYVFPQPRPPDHWRLRWRFAVVPVVAFTLLLRLFYMGAIDLMPEEAYYWNYAQNLDIGYLDHPPLVAWLIAGSTALFGDSEFAVRLPTLLCWGVTAYFLYRLARDLFDKSAGIVAIILVASLPFFLGAGFIMTPDAPLTACWAAALYYLHRIFVRDDANAWWCAGAAIGFGLLAKYSIAFILPALLVLMLRDRRWWTRPQPWGAGLLTLAIFSPVILWNAQNEWASFLFQSVSRAQGKVEFSFHIQLLACVAFLTPIGVRSLFLERRRSGFLAAFVFVPLGLILLFSLARLTKPHWLGPIFLAALPLLAVAVFRNATFARRWAATVTVVLGILSGLLHFLGVGYPGGYYPDKLRLPVGWREFSAQVQELRPDDTVIVAMSRYFTQSELRFYTGEPAVGQYLFGEIGLMYEFWSPPEQYAGRTLFIVGFEEKALDPDRFRGRVGALGPIERHVIERDGRAVGHFFTRVARDYRPAP